MPEMWSPKKPERGGSGGSKPPHADPGPFGSDYPALAWYLCSSTWPDETAKNPGRVELSSFFGKWQATLKVPGLGLMLRLEIPSPDLVFEALDAALRLESPPWVIDQWTQTEATKKGQKK